MKKYFMKHTPGNRFEFYMYDRRTHTAVAAITNNGSISFGQLTNGDFSYSKKDCIRLLKRELSEYNKSREQQIIPLFPTPGIYNI